LPEQEIFVMRWSASRRRITLSNCLCAAPVFAIFLAPSSQAQSSQSAPPPAQSTQQQPAPVAAQQAPQTAPAHEPTAAELSKNATVGTELMRTFGSQEYEFRAAAEAMPEDKYSFRPVAPTSASNAPTSLGPTQLRSFADQVKHVACANFAFAAELNGKTPPDNCENGGPDPAKTRTQLLTYLRNSFAAMNASLNAITSKNMYDPIEGRYAGPNTRLGLAGTAIWHVADHYGQVVMYLRLNGIVPPASRPNPPDLKDYPAH
jgi:DinB superfamily